MFTWGGISMCLAACNSYKTLAVVRLFLGIVEAGFAPGILFLLSSWYRKNELATRFALYYTASAFSGALGGLLAGAITGNLDGKGGLAGWRYLFLVSINSFVGKRQSLTNFSVDRGSCDHPLLWRRLLHSAQFPHHHSLVD